MRMKTHLAVQHFLYSTLTLPQPSWGTRVVGFRRPEWKQSCETEEITAVLFEMWSWIMLIIRQSALQHTASFRSQSIEQHQALFGINYQCHAAFAPC